MLTGSLEQADISWGCLRYVCISCPTRTLLTRRSDEMMKYSPASLYSLSFAQNLEWSTFTPPGKEIQHYLDSVCKRYRINDNIQLNTEITHLQWEVCSSQWRVTGTVIHEGKARTPFSFYAKVIINAAGKFIEPNLVGIQDVPGFEDFKGDVLHSSNWDSSLNLEGKNILVVGSGCTAAQIVPSLLKTTANVKTVTQLMRSAPWVRPRFLSKKAMGLWETHLPWLIQTIPLLAVIIRGIIFLVTESQFFLIFGSRSGRKRLKKKLIRYIQQAAPEKYHEILTPNYEVGCKRFVQDATWFESLHDPRMHLTTETFKRLTKDAVVLESQGNGEERVIPADVIVLATGYDTSTFFPSIKTTGKDGLELHQVWTERGGPQAYMGIAIDKFPNLFLLGGPNSSSGHTSVIINIENGLSYILSLLRPIVNGEVSTWEIKEYACTRWTANIQEASKNRVWKTGGCSNWYIGKNGWNGTVYP
jgi:cation diffusion facilitator CzcD-associated flavoprotein CzcO